MTIKTFLTMLRLILYFLITIITFLVSFIPTEFAVFQILISTINSQFEEVWLLIVFSPLIIAFSYLFSTLIFTLLHSTIVCKIFLPKVEPGVYSHSEISLGTIQGVSISRDAITKSLLGAIEWIPFITQVVLKPFFLRFYGLKLGSNVYIASKTYIDSSLTTIGSNSFIGHQALISNHLNEKGNVVIAPVTIGKNCVIGGLSLISPGVEIGDNVIIGAMSFVPKNKKIPSNSIWFGTPVKQYKPKEEKKV